VVAVSFPEQAAKKLGYTTLDRNVNTKPNK
jgi:hypothetical protein